MNRSASSVRIPLSAKLVVLTLLVPEELSFYVLGLRLTFTRLILLVLAPITIFKFFRKIATGQYRFVLSDLFVVLAGFWMIYAPANIDGLAPALNHAGPNVLEFCIGYLVMRVMLTQHDQAVAVAVLLCWCIAIAALVGLLDPLTNHYFARELASQLTGYVKQAREWDDAYRLGLLRATGSVEHPILFGFVCAIGLLLALCLRMRWKMFVIISCGAGAIFAFSSAPIQSVVIGVVLLGYNRIMSRVPFRWIALVVLGCIGVFAAFMISNSPVGFIIAHLTYTPGSGYYRQWTWTRVLEILPLSPWFGFGFKPEMGDVGSIDSVWLVLSLLYGVPGAILVALCYVGAVSLPSSGPKTNLSKAESKLGTSLGIIIFLTIFLGFTVHFWGITWILSGLITGLRAHIGELGRLSARPVRRPSSVLDNSVLAAGSSARLAVSGR